MEGRGRRRRVSLMMMMMTMMNDLSAFQRSGLCVSPRLNPISTVFHDDVDNDDDDVDDRIMVTLIRSRDQVCASRESL